MSAFITAVEEGPHDDTKTIPLARIPRICSALEQEVEKVAAKERWPGRLGLDTRADVLRPASTSHGKSRRTGTCQTKKKY